MDSGDVPPSPSADSLVGVTGHNNWRVEGEVEDTARVGAQLKGVENFPIESFRGADECSDRSIHYSPRLGADGSSPFGIINGGLKLLMRDPVVPYRFSPMHDDITVGDEGRVSLAFERAVGYHEGDVKLLTTKAAAGAAAALMALLC